MSFNLNYPIVLLEPQSAGRTESGASRPDNLVEHNTRAAILSTRGALNQYDGFEVAQLSITFVVRYRPDLKESWKVLWRDRIHKIDSIQPIAEAIKRKGWLRLICDTGNTTNLEVQEVQTGPQPVYAVTTTGSGGTPTTRTDYDVASLMGEVVDQPVAGTPTSVTFTVADPTPSGKHIVFLYPQAWGNPTAYYTGGNTAINQIGAFRFIPANLLGSTSQFSHRYRAMVSLNRKATDTPINDTVEWS